MNLVDLVQGQLGSNVLTRLAETLGTSPDNTRTAVNAAIPTLLTAFGSVASTRDGARDLAAAVGSLDDRLLDIGEAAHQSAKSRYALRSDSTGSPLGRYSNPIKPV